MQAIENALWVLVVLGLVIMGGGLIAMRMKKNKSSGD